MSFYVELPADEDGNTYMRKAVLECRVEMAPREPLPDSERLIIAAPEYHAAKWPGGWWLADMGGQQCFKEVDGPARMLTDGEWATLAGWEGQR